MKTWIERAIIAHSDRIEVRLAWSVEIQPFDWLDIKLMKQEHAN